MTACALHWQPVNSEHSARIAVLTLSRPEVANAMSAVLIDELIAHLREIALDAECRAVLLRGSGKHFCAGADLGWMREAAQLDLAGNIADAEKLTSLFESLANLPVPSIALVHGGAFGGGVGLAAACDVVIAVDNARFSLSEVLVGILPAVILPYLVRKVQPGTLRRWALTGRIMKAEEAASAGLVQRVVSGSEVDSALREELNALLAASPYAQSA